MSEIKKMMMKELGRKIINLATVLLVFNVSLLHAQTKSIASSEEDNIQCVSDFLHNRFMNTDQDYARSYEATEAKIREYTASRQGEGREPILTIPVVVHVVHKGEAVGTGSNISDAQVYSAIDALNEDYRKALGSNGDGAGVDSEVEFCLAVRGPDGLASSGINRVDGSGVTGYSDLGITVDYASNGNNEVEVKNLSRWPKADYYNIWVVSEIEDNNGGAGIQGYAYFPNAPSSVDGAVMLYNAFGTVGNLKSYTNRNRTATHEIGHALNLYHTFEGGSCTEDNCATDGDKVCDTPPTAGNNTNCGMPECSGTQLVENYMDYTGSDCKDMFTAGQKTRMRAALTGSRASLLQSDACTPVSVNDVAIDEIVSPAGNLCTGSIIPEVRVRNFGSATITSALIDYSVDSVAYNQFTFSGSIESGSSVLVQLPSIAFITGSHSLTVSVSSPNGQVDEYQSNDSQTSNFTLVSGSTLTVELSLDNYGSESSWTLRDSNNSIVSASEPYQNGQVGTVTTTEVCVTNGCYEFTMYDTYGDGLISPAYYKVTDSGQGVVVTGSGFTYNQVSNFCLDNTPATTPISDFSASDVSVCSGDAIDFSDLSTGVPASWSWTFDGAVTTSSTLQNPTGIVYNTPGVYNVTLTCTNSEGSSTELKTAYINVISAPVIGAVVSDNLCSNDQVGAVDVTVTGGTSPYVYQWSNGISTEDLSGLMSGTYSLGLTDAAGCVSNTSYTVQSPAPITITPTVINPSSGINDGAITVSVVGGTAPYSYSWTSSNGYSSSNMNIQGLDAGNYTLTIVDVNGCSVMTIITLTVEVELVADFAGVNMTLCPGSSISFVDGSTGNPTSWAWQFDGADNSTSTLQNPTGIIYNTPGVFSVTLTVSNSTNTDTEVKTGIITVVSAPQVSPSVSDVMCNDSQNGAIDISVSGGTAPFVYQWSNGSSSEDVSGLEGGSYSVAVTDVNGCSSTTDIAVQEPDEISINVLNNNPDQNDMGVGSIEVQVSGGTAPYTQEWFESGVVIANSLSIEDLLSGIYTLVVTDANGCSKSEVVTLLNMDSPIANYTAQSIACVGQEISFVDISTNDPTVISWIFVGGSPALSTDSNPIISYSMPGTYTVVLTATSIFGTDTKTGSIVINDALDVQLVSMESTCTGTSNGSLEVGVSGGESPYTYSWSEGGSTNSLDELSSGTYTLLVQDVNQCEANFSAYIEADDCVGVSEISSDDGSLIIYPNPFAGDRINLYYSSDEQPQIELFDITGKAVGVEIINVSSDLYQLSTLSTLGDGVYFLKIVDGDNVVTKKISVAK